MFRLVEFHNQNLVIRKPQTFENFIPQPPQPDSLLSLRCQILISILLLLSLVLIFEVACQED